MVRQKERDRLKQRERDGEIQGETGREETG